MRIRANVTGKPNMKGALSKITLRLETEMPKALLAQGQALLDDSLPLVPVDTVTLKKSGRMRPEGSKFNFVVHVGYGGTDIPKMFVQDRKGKWRWQKASDYAATVHAGYNQHKGLTFVTGQPNYLGEPLASAATQGKMRRAGRQLLLK